MKSIKHLINLFIVVCMLFMVYGLSSCHNSDIFDPEAYAKMVSDSFPVKNIDPNQNWQTIGTAKASVYVNEDAGKTYTIKIFDKNPIFNPSAVLLASGSVTNGNTWTGTCDYPLADSAVYVTRVDSKARREVSVAKISNGTISASFSYGNSTKAMMSRATTRTGVTIPSENAPYTASQITTMLKKATDASTVANLPQGGNNYYYISNYSGAISYWDTGSDYYLIVKGKWTLSSSLQQIGSHLHIIVASGGQIVIPSGYDLQSYGTGDLTVMNGGTVSGGGKFEVANGMSTYNGGTINIGSLNNNGGTFYNADQATLNVSSAYTATAASSTLINWGNCTINDMSASGNGSNAVVETACKMTVTNELSAVQVYIGDGASLECGSYYNDNNSYVNFGVNSIFQVDGVSTIQNTHCVGPTTGYAIYKTSGWYMKNYCYFYNNLYVDDDTSKDNSNNWFVNQLSSTSDKSVVFVDNATAPLAIPASTCSIGYNDNGSGQDNNDYTNFTYIYAFEDMYPEAGDYDFNDVVLAVNKSQNDNNVTLKITLLAAGAIKQDAAAIRIMNIKPSDISSGSWTSPFLSYYSDGTNRVKLIGSKRVNTILESTCANNNEVVIPLFNDAHCALIGKNPTARYTLNTHVINGVVYPSEKYTPVTATLNIVTATKSAADSINARNLDLFITYRQNGVSSNIEVHTFPWKSNATTIGKIFTEADNVLDGKAIWAICVPSTWYWPTETTSIELAYPKFTNWAADMTSNKDWYNSYVSGKVFPENYSNISNW